MRGGSRIMNKNTPKMLQTANLRTASVQQSYYSLYNSVLTLRHNTLKTQPTSQTMSTQVPFKGGLERFVTFRECFIKKPWTFPERAGKTLVTG